MPSALPFTVISVALLISGLASPFLGRQIDRHGAPRIMVLGSIAVGWSMPWLPLRPISRRLLR